MKASSPALHHVHFPGESAEYRAARNALLAEEIELRRQTERVAVQRRTVTVYEGGDKMNFNWEWKNDGSYASATSPMREWSTK